VLFKASECGAENAPKAPPTSAPTLPQRPSNSLYSSPVVAAAPTRRPLDCIDSWVELNSSINDSFNESPKNSFTLCPDKVYEVQEEAIVLRSNGADILIECGAEGDLFDNCTIAGGQSHFHILGEGIKVTFRGTRFKGSKDVSILAAADRDSLLIFKACEWAENEGSSAVIIHNGDEEYMAGSTISSLSDNNEAMEVYFDNCSFRLNPVKFALIANIGGKAEFSFTAFDSNQNIAAGCINCRGEQSRLELRNNCFIDNESDGPGPVYLSDGAEMLENEGNYGLGNTIDIDMTCVDIFTLAIGESCDSESCPGTCSTFDAKSCSISDYEYAAPSTTPSTTALSEGANGSGQSGLSSKDNNSNSALETSSLFSSGFFIRNFLIGVFTVLLGIAAFIYCKKKHSEQKGDKNKEKKKEDDEHSDNNQERGESLEHSEERETGEEEDQEEEFFDDIDLSEQKEEKSRKKSFTAAFSPRGKKKKKKKGADSAEVEVFPDEAAYDEAAYDGNDYDDAEEINSIKKGKKGKKNFFPEREIKKE